MRMVRDVKSDGTAGNHDVNQKDPSGKDTRCFTVNLSEDDDMHFSSNLNIATDELAQESDILFCKYLDAVESDDEVQAISIEDDHPTRQTHGGALNKATVDAKSTVAEPPTHRREVIFEDTVVPEESHPGSKTNGRVVNRATVDAKSNIGELSSHRREVIFEANMVPEDFSTYCTIILLGRCG